MAYFIPKRAFRACLTKHFLIYGVLGVAYFLLLSYSFSKPGVQELQQKEQSQILQQDLEIVRGAEVEENERESDEGDYAMNPIEDPQEHTAEDSDDNSRGCLEWTNRAPKPPYFLATVLSMRIYEADKAKLTTKELKMWLQYQRYAGVEHVYVYDSWLHKNESQLNALKPFLEDGYVTYTNWHSHNPFTTRGTLVKALQHAVDNFANETLWQVSNDIDEYPFSPRDTASGFLYRYVKDFSNLHPEVSEITMENFLFLGKPLDKELMIERVLRRTPKPSNNLANPFTSQKMSAVHRFTTILCKPVALNVPQVLSYA